MSDILSQVASCSFVDVALGECISGSEQWSRLGAKLCYSGSVTRGRKLNSAFPDEFLLAVRAEIRRAHEDRVSISTDVTNSGGSPRSAATFTREDPHWNSAFPPLASTNRALSPARNRPSCVESAFARPVQPISCSRPSRRIVVTKVSNLKRHSGRNAIRYSVDPVSVQNTFVFKLVFSSGFWSNNQVHATRSLCCPHLCSQGTVPVSQCTSGHPIASSCELSCWQPLQCRQELCWCADGEHWRDISRTWGSNSRIPACSAAPEPPNFPSEERNWRFWSGGS